MNEKVARLVAEVAQLRRLVADLTDSVEELLEGGHVPKDHEPALRALILVASKRVGRRPKKPQARSSSTPPSSCSNIATSISTSLESR